VRLLSCSTERHIQCELTHRYLDYKDVDGRKAYLAVSYCWGQSPEKREGTRRITMDGVLFMVSPVIMDILIRLQNPTCDQLFWLDLISIDQDNISEKELQVSRMGDIFQQAFRVIVSLGPHFGREAHLAQPALHFLRCHGIIELLRMESESKAWIGRWHLFPHWLQQA
jgi:hypothetical protein